MKIAYPESIEEAINQLEQFLDSDLYTKFRPEIRLPIKKRIEKWYRKDFFLNEKEFREYLFNHFEILRKQIIKLIGKKQFKSKRITL
jgi:hypothetical protein